jgi:hypothetical protein
MSFLGKIWNKVKDLGGKVWSGIKDVGAKYTPNFKASFQTIANAFRAKNPASRPLEPGEFHYGFHNYTGPGTRIDLHPNTPPINHIDKASMDHDYDYGDAAKIKDPTARARAVHEADMKAIKEYNKYPKEDGYKPAVLGIAGKWGAEQALSYFKGKDSTFYG